tara:strand:- start:82 stop:633 length:552 start_codon:yes stop_codon:yes gene_type:complete
MLNSLVVFLQIFNLTKVVGLLAISIIIFSFTLSGCVSRNLSETTKERTISEKTSPKKTRMIEFSDIPIPRTREINLDKTMVVGSEYWFGRLTFDTGQSAENIFTFYTRELINYGWKKITAVRSQTSLMTYERENRIINIAIEQNRIHGSEVRITMSPRESSVLPNNGSSPIIEKPIKAISSPK